MKSLVSKVLNECELKMYKSVAFPAIGTGLRFLGKAIRTGTELIPLIRIAVGLCKKLCKLICESAL